MPNLFSKVSPSSFLLTNFANNPAIMYGVVFAAEKCRTNPIWECWRFYRQLATIASIMGALGSMVGAAVEVVSGSAWFDSRLFLGVKRLGTKL